MNWQAPIVILTILAMMTLVFQVTRFVSSSPNNLYAAVINGYIRNNLKCKSWISEYNIYYWSLLLNVCLIIMILTLCASLSEGNLLRRKEVALIIAPFMWYSVYKCNVWYHNKLKK